MILYKGSWNEDVLIAKIWWTLVEDKELSQVVEPSAQTLLGFLLSCRNPNCVLYEADNLGIWGVLWARPSFSGASIGFWLRKDYRKSRSAYKFFCSAIDLCFTQWPVLLGVTCQPRLLRLHKRLGYTLLGCIPGLWNGLDTWLLYLTRENFNECTRKRRRRSE